MKPEGLLHGSSRTTGVEYEFPEFDLHRRPVVVSFDLDGHPASVTMRGVGTAVPGGHVGVGVIPMTTFVTYELVVDRLKRGTWGSIRGRR